MPLGTLTIEEWAGPGAFATPALPRRHPLPPEPVGTRAFSPYEMPHGTDM